MIDDILQLCSIDLSSLKLPRLGYADQLTISHKRVDLAIACAIHCGLHVGIVIRYLKEGYVGESRNADAILNAVSSCIDKEDCAHIIRIINQGCLSHLVFEN